MATQTDPVYSNNGLTIEKVESRAQLKEFIALPQRLYADDPNWVMPLWFEQFHRFGKKNPFFLHATWQTWLVRRGAVVVGRISAQIDDLYYETQGEYVGNFGLIEADDDADVFSLLLDTAAAWLKEKGMASIRGPLNLSINEEMGLLVEGLDTPPYFMMGHSRPYYDARIKEAGFGKAKDLFAYEIHPDFENPKVMHKLLAANGNVTIRCINRKNLKQDLEVLRDIFNDSWSNNWGFVPMTKEEFADVGEMLAALLDDDFIQIAEVEGVPVAMIVAIPDLNHVIKDLRGHLFPFGWAKLLWRLKVKFPHRARVMLMGVRKEYQHTRLGPALALSVVDAVRTALLRKNVTKVEMSWILEDNDGMNGIARRIGGVVSKRYRVYEKALT